MRRPFLISFLVGGLVFGVIYYMLLDDPCVETTNFHMEPNVVTPGQTFSAVWTDKTLRECDGIVFRRFISKSGGDVWVFPPVHTVHHDKPVSNFHTSWIAPHAPPGTEMVFRKDIRRWANFIQKWWPMEESQEAPFSIAGPAPEPHQP